MKKFNLVVITASVILLIVGLIVEVNIFTILSLIGVIALLSYETYRSKSK